MKLKSLLTFLAVLLLIVPGKAQTLRRLDMGKNPLAQHFSKRSIPQPASLESTKVQVDDLSSHGIITTAPDGDHLFYARAGITYYTRYEEIYTGEQSGSVETVDCGDGTVYIKDIISSYAAGSWVKGTKKGNTITVATRQPIAYSEEYNATLSLRWGIIDLEGNLKAADDIADVITFEIEDGVISLQGTSADEAGKESRFIGIFWDDDNAATGSGDAETVWTPIEVVTKVDQLPYLNTFETVGEQAAFTIIDANGDGTTWGYIMNSDDEHYARYSYSEYNDADDWLVSPAIWLEAGKTYLMAFDTRIADSEENIEVKMGREATAEAMVTQVIDPTEVTWEENKTLSNDHVAVDETGYYYFGIHAISERDKYRLYADNFFFDEVEMGAPDAVTDLQVVPTPDQLEATVTFTAPSTSRNGNELTQNLSVELLRDGEVIYTFDNVKPGTAQTYVDNADDLTIGYHTYQVVASNEKGAGKKSDEVTVYLDAILEVPYTSDFTQEGTIATYQVIDNNNDGSTWQWENGYGTSYVYSSDNQGDDYLISPRIHLQGGKNYYMTVNAVTSGYPERLEVLLGKEPSVEALTTQVMAPVDVTNFNDPGDFFEQIFSVPEDGIYHIALHAISDADQDHLTVNFISIEDGPAPSSPAAPDFEVIPDAKGELIAEVRMTVPALAYDGIPLGNILYGGIDIYRDGEMIGSVYGAMPVGETLSYLDALDTNGYHEYRLIPYSCESGYGVRSARDTVYVGVDVPTAVGNFTAVDNVDHATLHWDKVGEVGVNDLYVNPEKVAYNIWSTRWEEGWFGMELTYDQQLASLTDNDTFDVVGSTVEGDQHWTYWVVEPESAAGTGDNSVTGLVMGAPYQLPVTEGFADNALHYFWDSDAELLVSSDSSDGDGSALALLSRYEGESYFISGKLDVKDADYPVLLCDVKGLGITQLNITGSIDGPVDETILQSGVPVTKEYTTVCIPLTALKNGRYAHVGFTAEFVNPTEFDWFGEVETLGDVLLVDNVRIVDDQELAIGGVEAASQSLLDVYTTDGKLVRRQAKSLAGLKGTFVVRQEGKGKTIVVR